VGSLTSQPCMRPRITLLFYFLSLFFSNREFAKINVTQLRNVRPSVYTLTSCCRYFRDFLMDQRSITRVAHCQSTKSLQHYSIFQTWPISTKFHTKERLCFRLITRLVRNSCESGNEPSGSTKCWETIKWLHSWGSLE
jgi:hypothetical protein